MWETWLSLVNLVRIALLLICIVAFVWGEGIDKKARVILMIIILVLATGVIAYG